MQCLIPVNDLTSHLRFLGAAASFFEVLSKDHVAFNQSTGFPSATQAGKVFLRRAVYRLKLWIKFVLRPKHLSGTDSTLQSFELPPFDVLIMLHAYMLHPHRFYEDMLRLHPELAVIEGFPLAQVVRLSGVLSPLILSCLFGLTRLPSSMTLCNTKPVTIKCLSGRLPQRKSSLLRSTPLQRISLLLTVLTARTFSTVLGFRVSLMILLTPPAIDVASPSPMMFSEFLPFLVTFEVQAPMAASG
jgi:hypothetical protein